MSELGCRARLQQSALTMADWEGLICSDTAEMGRIGGIPQWKVHIKYGFLNMKMEIVFNSQGFGEIVSWTAWIPLRIHKQEALRGPINADRQSSQRFPGRPSNFTSYHLNLVPITTTFI